MLRIAIPRALLGMAAPFYAQKSPLHGNRKCRRYMPKMKKIDSGAQ
jgi:hypothetical protein